MIEYNFDKKKIFSEFPEQHFAKENIITIFFMLDEIFHIFGIQKYIAISFIYIFLPYALAYRSANKILMYIAKGKKKL